MRKDPVLRLKELYFDGETYVESLDKERLQTSLERVFAFMSDGDWHTLNQISLATGSSESGVSARLRDLRKERFGGHTVISQRIDYVWVYRLQVRWSTSHITEQPSLWGNGEFCE